MKKEVQETFVWPKMDSENFDIKYIHTQFWDFWNNLLGPSFQDVCWWIRPIMHFTEDNNIVVPMGALHHVCFVYWMKILLFVSHTSFRGTHKEKNITI